MNAVIDGRLKDCAYRPDDRDGSSVPMPTLPPSTSDQCNPSQGRAAMWCVCSPSNSRIRFRRTIAAVSASGSGMVALAPDAGYSLSIPPTVTALSVVLASDIQVTSAMEGPFDSEQVLEPPQELGLH